MIGVGNPDIWIPVIVTAAINLILFAYFMGGINAKLKNLAENQNKLLDVRISMESRVSVLEQRVIDHENKLSWGTHRFEEIFRGLMALGRGDKLPASAYNPPPAP